MPSIEVEAPRRSQVLSLDDPFHAGSVSRTPSHTAVINIDDDEDDALRGQPPTNRRRIERENDVYLLEDDNLNEITEEGSSTNNNGGRNQPIIVLDSDDEEHAISASTLNTLTRHARTRVSLRAGEIPPARYRIFSPPPPPRQHHPIPPVPPVPPPIIAHPAPFAIFPPPREDGPSRANSLFGERPSQPSGSSSGSGSGGRGIQLGGGLVSFGNRAAGHHPGYQQETHDNNPRGASASSIATFSGFGRIVASFLANNARPAQPPPAERIAWPHRDDDDDYVWNGWGSAGGLVDLFGDRHDNTALGPPYYKNLTHPDRPGPGWTFDFGPDPDQIDAEDDASEILVCAQCLDPLLANSDGMVAVSEAEKKERRVWGLRCGHVLDGKCMAALMIPEDEQEKMSLKGKEKESCIPIEEEKHEFDVVEELSSADIKGKGKAPAPSHTPTPIPTSTCAPEHIASPAPISVIEDNQTIDLSGIPPAPEPADTSIRSRLRSRRGPTSVPLLSLPLTPRRGTKRKRAPRPRAPSPVIIERQHDWVCPVAKCGMVHASYKAKGAWKTDEELGPVAMYV